MRTISMKCANCGKDLHISHDMDHFACGYCGKFLSVVRRGGTVVIQLATDLHAKVHVGVDQAAAELALVRLQKEIKERCIELDAQGERIRYLETEINMASLPSTGNRKLSIFVSHAFVAIVRGGAIGFFMGFFVNWFFQEWLPSSVGVFVGIVIAMSHAIGHFFDPTQVSARLGVYVEDSGNEIRCQSLPFNVEELKKLRPARNALKDRLQKLNVKLSETSAIVNS